MTPKKVQYDFKGHSLDNALRDARKENRDLNNIEFTDIAPSTLANDAEFQDENEDFNFNLSNQADFNNPERYNDEEFVENIENIAPNISSKTVTTTYDNILGCVSWDDYLKNIEVHNKKQREFLYHVLHTTKTSEDPYHIVLTGGAGVGKSVLIDALHETLQRYYIHNYFDENLDMPRVMLIA